MNTPSRRPAPPLVHCASLVALVAVAASGAGCDSLLGEDGLNSVFASGSAPAVASWELRWFLGPDAGLRSQCDLMEPLEGEVSLDADFGSLEIPPPAPNIPGATLDGGDYTWALATLLVVDADASRDRPASAADPLASVWGIASLHGILQVTGDLDRFSDDLGLLSAQGATGLVQGFQTVEIFPSDIVNTGSFVGGLAVVDPTIVFTEADGVLVADPLSFVDPDAERLVAGEALGGLTFEACP